MKFERAALTSIGLLLICSIEPAISDDGHPASATAKKCICAVPTNPRDWGVFQPLLQDHSARASTSGTLLITYPHTISPNLVIKASSVELVCNQGDTLAHKSKPLPYASSAMVNCSNSYPCSYQLVAPWGQHLADFNSFSEIGCTRQPIPDAKLLTSCKYLNNTCSACLEIGFQTARGFLPVIDNLVLDRAKLRPLVARVFLTDAIASRQNETGVRKTKRGPIFRDADVRIEEVYGREYQRKRFFEIFGDRQLVDKYVPESGTFYLSKGHLISERDLFYTSEQAAVFFYENTVPIWRDVAVGNWELAGEFLRKLAVSTRETGLVVWSGTIGVLELPDQRGTERRIFLAQGRDGEPLIPVPKLLYKYAATKRPGDNHWRALVLVTVNDPRLSLAGDDLVRKGYQLSSCSPKPICQQMQPEYADPKRGYTYCCSAQEFEPIARELGLHTFPDATMLV